MPAQSRFLPSRSRRNIIFFSALAVALVTLYAVMVQIPAMARGRVESLLAGAGFEHARIGDITLRPTGLRVRDIKLDSYGFDEIRLLDADVNWGKFIASGELSQMTINGISLTRTEDAMSGAGQQLIKILLHLPRYRVNISDATLDLATDYGSIRLTLDANVNSDSDAASRDIRAKLNSEQYQIGFNSSWEGALQDNGQLDLSGTILDGRVNVGALRISRFNGWSALSLNGNSYSLQTQMEAGSASIMDVPLQKLSLVQENTGEQSTALLRFGVSGVPDVMFTGDFVKKGDAATFDAALGGTSLSRFLGHVEKATGRQKILRPPLQNSRAFKLTSRFQPERRFVGGPLPFSLDLELSGSKTAEGNFLFYPDTLDVRGSLETDGPMAEALQDYFKIPSENINQNFIRLDGSAKKFFENKKAQANAGKNP